ncbi:MAG: hypothetical protein BGO35_03855 [Burkholderiales bacterium 64-34]|nr:MAG: hypothetical protein BGO35_03855 [Burkholderiales bacterium 64-34]
MRCATCGEEKETRPYGKGGAAICFGCAMGSDDTRREAEAQFSAQLHACGPVAVLGNEAGPYPLKGTSPEH